MSCLSGPKIQPDLRNQTNQIPQQEDLRTGRLKKDQELTQVPIQEMPQEPLKSTEIEIDPTALRTVKISLLGSQMRSLFQYHPTVIKLQEYHGHVNIVLMSIILV